jgi:predicted AlkP superfamily pyrophosphatase or phosphodiesterase
MKEKPRKTIWQGAGFALALVLLLACTTAAVAPQGSPHSRSGQDAGPPTLVVLLVVDQLRGDMLDWYSSLFTGGLRRLLDQGLRYTDAAHEHGQTETSPGHAAVSTGVYPGRAGVPSNVWQESDGVEFHPVYNVVDPEVGLVDISGLPGSSPSVLNRTGLPDWMIEADNKAKVVSVSAKDRAAVLMAGKSKGEVYWFEPQVGWFVTSTYYRSRYPTWLRRFNERGMEKYLADSVWTSIVPAEARSLSAPDTASFEGDGIHSYFPHVFSQEITDPEPGDISFWLETTPMLDHATLDVALLAVEEEELGRKDDRTDFLAISFSQTDRIGHAYGPRSREQMDNLLRLDRLLGKLFDVLDRDVGALHYIVGFTSDHGIMDNPERIQGGGLRLQQSHRSELEQALSTAVRQAGMRRELSTAEAIVEAMEPVSFVGPAYTQDQLQNLASRDSLAALFLHSLTPGRLGGLLSRYGVEMWWTENILPWGMPQGTTHGSPYFYDRWVPLILMGPGIEPGSVGERVRPMDLAPTLAALAGIPFPSDLDGRPLLPGRN